MADFQEIMQCRKSGATDKAYEMAMNALSVRPDDLWIKRATAWVLYDKLKALLDKGSRLKYGDILNEMVKLNLPDDEEMFQVNLSRQVCRIFRAEQNRETPDPVLLDELLNYLIKINWDLRTESYAVLLEALLAFKKDWPGRHKSLQWWGLENLRPEDFQHRKTKDGKRYMSLAESAYGGMSRSWLQILRQDPHLVADMTRRPEIEKFIDTLRIVQEENPGFQYLAYYRARLLMVLQSPEEAIADYLPFVRKNEAKPWAWELLGDLHQANPNVAINCYGRALQCPDPEEFLVACRLKLAKALFSVQSFAESKRFLLDYVATRQRMGWSVPREVVEMLEREPLNTLESVPDLKPFYTQVTAEAGELLFPSDEQEFAVVQFVNQAKKMVHVLLTGEKVAFFTWQPKYGALDQGDVIRLSVLLEGSGFAHVRKLNRAPFSEINGLTRVGEGRVICMVGKEFGMLKDNFIPPQLMKSGGVHHGDTIRCECMRSFDRKKERWGWVAVRLEKVY